MQVRCQQRSQDREAVVFQRIRQEEAAEAAKQYKPSVAELETKQIASLKSKMHYMERTRAQKDVDANADNAYRIERDAIRHERFLAEFENPEQKAKRLIREHVGEIGTAMAGTEVEEDTNRDMLEQEQAEEFKVFNHMHHLEIFSNTVRLVTEGISRKQRQADVLAQNRERHIKTTHLMLGSLCHEESEARYTGARSETAEFRQVAQKWKAAYSIVRGLEDRRWDAEQAALDAQAEELEKQRLREAEREVELYEADVEFRIQRITQKFLEPPAPVVVDPTNLVPTKRSKPPTALDSQLTTLPHPHEGGVGRSGCRIRRPSANSYSSSSVSGSSPKHDPTSFEGSYSGMPMAGHSMALTAVPGLNGSVSQRDEFSPAHSAGDGGKKRHHHRGSTESQDGKFVPGLGLDAGQGSGEDAVRLSPEALHDNDTHWKARTDTHLPPTGPGTGFVTSSTGTLESPPDGFILTQQLQSADQPPGNTGSEEARRQLSPSNDDNQIATVAAAAGGGTRAVRHFATQRPARLELPNLQ